VSAESLLTQAGMLEHEATAASGGQTATVIEKDPRLKPEQRSALLAVYQSYLEANEAEGDADTAGATKPRTKVRGSVKKSS
jgi:hypothetical protein